MRIISFNIGIKIDNAKEIVDYLKVQDADIVCLQEVVRSLEEGVFSMYCSERIIRESLKDHYPYYFFAPEWTANKLIEKDGIKNRDFGGMVESGKMILSKYPIIHGYNYFYNKIYEFDCDRINFYKGDDHGRALQICDIDINSNIIQIGNVHGMYSSDKLDTEKSILQSNFIIDKLDKKRLPTILLGDFNVLPETKSVSIINEKYQNLNIDFDISSTRPKGQMVDYIFINNEFIAKDLKVGDTDISDHYPLIVEIDFNKN